MISLKELFCEVEERMKTERDLIGYDEERNNELKKIFEKEQDLKLMASQGSTEARQFIKNKIFFMLTEIKDINNENIDSIIKQYHVNYFKNIYVGNYKNYNEGAIDAEIEEYLQKFTISEFDSIESKKIKLAQIIYQELYGFSIIDELVFDSILNEVDCQRYDFISIQYKGVKRNIPNKDFKFESNKHYKMVVESRITSTALEEINPENPHIYASLLNGYRVSAMIPSLSKHITVAIRLFTYKDLPEDKKDKFMTEKMMKLIFLLIVKGRRNATIVGEMGSGKTTLLNLLISFLDKHTAIGIIENRHELDVSVMYPYLNVIETQYREGYGPSDLIEIFLRFNRDIIMFGEVRSPEEAEAMIDAKTKQSRGSLATSHSRDARRYLHNMRKLLMRTGNYSSYREAQYDVADADDLIIQIRLDMKTGKRYVQRIVELVANEDMTYEIRDLFVYNKITKKIQINPKGVSEKTLEDCLEYELEPQDVRELKELFIIKPGEEEYYEELKLGGIDNEFDNLLD